MIAPSPATPPASLALPGPSASPKSAASPKLACVRKLRRNQSKERPPVVVLPAFAIQGNSLKEPVLLPVVHPVAAQKHPFVKVVAAAPWLNYVLSGVARSNYPSIKDRGRYSLGRGSGVTGCLPLAQAICGNG